MGSKKDYTYRSLHHEREYGIYWYSGVWAVLRPILIGVITIIVVTGLLVSIWNHLYDAYIAPVDPEQTDGIAFDVASGQSLNRVSRNLESAGLIRSSTVFKYYCDFSGFGQKIQAGSYVIAPSMGMLEIADLLTTGDGNPLVRNITLIPGWTLSAFADYLVEKGLLTDRNAFLELCRTGNAFRDFHYIDELPKDGKMLWALEGYLAANTYEVYTSSTPEEIIRKLLSQTERLWNEVDQARADELGMSMHEIFTLASLIEKEAGKDDFAKVSAVFHNRLKDGMALASDVTIHYVTGVRKMALTAEDLAVKSPYNTYTNKGLPPGPICAPSARAIEAALYPDETYVAMKYLYFCAGIPGSGELHFSRTLAEHEEAVRVYAPLWEAWDRERGIE